MLDTHRQDPRFPELGQDEDSAGLDIREIWRIINKHKWSILGLTALVTLIGGLMVYREVPIYRATTTLQIERNPARVAPVQDWYTAYTEGYLYYQTQYGLIKRRAIAERVVQNLAMAPDPAAPPEPPQERGFSWKSLLPEDWFPEPRPPTAEERYDRVVNSVLNRIRVDSVDNTQLVRISIEHPQPEQAARLANAVAEAFIEDNLAGRVEMEERAASYLTERLVELREKLSASELALQDYLDQEQLVDVRGVDGLASQELTSATAKLTAARRDRSEIETVYRQIQSARSEPEIAVAEIPALLEYGPVQQANATAVTAEQKRAELARTYGPMHPKMIAAVSELEAARGALDRQIQRVIGSIEIRYETAVADERSAAVEVERIRAQLRELDRKEFTLEALQREVETNRQIFEKFQTQFKEADAAGNVSSANARIVEAARVPGAPVKPNKQRSLLMSLFLGLVASLGLAFLLEHLDNTMKSAEDVEQRLNIPVLGLLPNLKTKDHRDLSPLRHFAASPKTAFAEAIRTIRTGVLLSSLDDAHRILLVTSSVPGEGKTTLSMNLARALAEMKRVLLIDADMRRPTIARALDESTPPKGLSHFISGEAELLDCVREIAPNFHVMSAGVAPPNPLELLSSVRFAKALDNMADKFDHIVLDCAPALAVSDAMVLSKLATAVIYVVRSDSTPVQAAQAGLKRLRRCDAHVIGAVVNRALRRTRPYYGKYSYYYGDSYYSDYGYVSEKV